MDGHWCSGSYLIGCDERRIEEEYLNELQLADETLNVGYKVFKHIRRIVF